MGRERERGREMVTQCDSNGVELHVHIDRSMVA